MHLLNNCKTANVPMLERIVSQSRLCLLRLESPTRTLTMEAPRGVEVSAENGPLRVSGRKDLQLESTEGEVRTYSGIPHVARIRMHTAAVWM